MSKKIKVLFAIGSLSNLGGAEKLVVNQLENIDRDRFEPHLMMLFPERTGHSYKNEEISAIVHEIKFRGPFDIINWYRVYKILKHENFDILCSHLFESNFIIRTVNILIRCKNVFTFEHNVYWKKSWWKILADRLLSYQTTKIFVDSKAIANFTSQQEKINPEKFSILPYPIKLNKNHNPTEALLLKREIGLQPKNLVVGAVARFVEQKGLSFFIQSAKKIVDKNPPIPVSFLLVGFGGFEKQLKDESHNLGLDGKLIFSSPRNIQSVLSILDIFVVTSLWEGQPIAMLEAMAAGVPVVATKVGGIPEILVDRKNGLLVESKDVTGISNSIFDLLTKPDLRKSLVQEAQITASQFGLPVYINKLEKFFIDAYESR